MTKRALIIGGGHNGMVCACYLARAGVSVTVLERHHRVGGAAITEEFHPGFRNSVASYTVSLLHPKVIDDLHLHQHGLRILEREVNNFIPLPDGRSLTSYPDHESMRREVAKFSIADADRLQPFFDSLDGVVGVIRDLMLETPPALHKPGFSDLWQLFSLSVTFNRMSIEEKRQLLRLFSGSAGELLDDHFESDPIKALIGFDAIVGNYASPYQAGSAYVLLHHVIGEVNGKQGRWGHAVGGMGAISDAIAKEANSLGVMLETDVTVKQVLVQNNRALGVLLENGETLHADLVVSGVNPKLLYLSLLDEGDISDSAMEHFRQYKCQSGSFRMNVALSELPTFSADTPENALTGGVIMAPSLRYMDQAYYDATRHGFSREPVVEMMIPSVVDSSLAPDGQHVASLFCQQFDPSLGDAWASRRDEAAETIIETVNKFAPGFRESIIGTQVLSPWDLEQRFGLIGGDIFHGRLSLDQLFTARPMLGAGQYQTEVDGLFMCGSGTHPGGGVSGAPGHNAAREILRRI
jgi:phytoene dehydrogenase-like protein